MNTQDREEIERHFATRFAADPAQQAVTYKTFIEDVPSHAVDIPTKMLWFDVVGRGGFSQTLFDALSNDVYFHESLTVVNGVTVATKNRFSGRIIGIGFSFDA